MPAKSTTMTTPIGKIIRKARLDKKLSHDILANATGLSLDYLKKIESGTIRPPVGTLISIARALGIDSATLLKAKAAGVKERVAAFAKRTDNYAYTTLTPGAEKNHLKAFRITVDAKTEHNGVGYQHQGEEFVYVLNGQVQVDVGKHINQLKKGESLLFNANIKHKMCNPGDQPAELLIVIYTP
ncbi:MAG: cupin domain-containing protein [Desulfobacteraceae bacterium]